MRRLIFATNNSHKVAEVRAALEGVAEVVTLAEAGLHGEIPETADTLQGNALQKAQWVVDKLKCSRDNLSTYQPTNLSTRYDGVFADDTGLEVDALGGAPGVYSARYAGEHCSFDDNVNKLLRALEGKSNRRADFRTVICLIEVDRLNDDKLISSCNDLSTHQTVNLSTRYFEGRVDGQILTERHSNGEGFGYDPVFMPDRFAVSFAEMPLSVKNLISHRGLAVKKLADYLKQQ